MTPDPTTLPLTGGTAKQAYVREVFRSIAPSYDLLNRVLNAYEPAANRIGNTVAVNFVQERERVIRQQQEAIRELSGC